jgi:hypothetical protein
VVLEYNPALLAAGANQSASGVEFKTKRMDELWTLERIDCANRLASCRWLTPLMGVSQMDRAKCVLHPEVSFDLHVDKRKMMNIFRSTDSWWLLWTAAGHIIEKV